MRQERRRKFRRILRHLETEAGDGERGGNAFFETGGGKGRSIVPDHRCIQNLSEPDSFLPLRSLSLEIRVKGDEISLAANDCRCPKKNQEIRENALLEKCAAARFLSNEFSIEFRCGHRVYNIA